MAKYEYPLHLAAQSGDYCTVRSLLHQEIDINEVGLESPECGKETVECLVKTIDVNQKDSTECTALHYAVIYGHIDIVKLLIEKGANIDQKNYLGWTPLHLAAEKGHKDIVQLLFELGANCQLTGTSYEVSHLQVAAQYGRTNVIEYFLEQGADVNYETVGGFNLLHIAARFGHENLTEFLINKGADINAVTKYKGLSPLHYAASYNWPKIIDFLIQKGADLDLENTEKCTPFDLTLREASSYTLSSQQEECKESLKILIKYILLRNKSTNIHFPADYPYLEEMMNFQHTCRKEIQYMNQCLIGNSTVSLYTFLKDVFNDNSTIATYLYNENIIRELQNPEKYLTKFLIYSNVDIMIKDKIEKGIKMRLLLEQAYVIMENIAPQLPRESRIEIFSYLSIRDLQSFIKSIKTS